MIERPLKKQITGSHGEPVGVPRGTRAGSHGEPVTTSRGPTGNPSTGSHGDPLYRCFLSRGSEAEGGRPIVGRAALPAPVAVRFATCQWLHGDGPFTDADKCGRPNAPGKPYCQEHAERARLWLGDDDGGDQ